MPGRVADKQTGGCRNSREVVLERRGTRKSVVSKAKLDAPAAAPVGATRKTVVMQLSAELECVLADEIGDMVDELEACIRSLHLWPVESAQFLRKDVEVGNVDAG